MNQLKVNQQTTIAALYEQGWSKRRIARELGVDRLTVRRYLAAAQSKSPTHPHTGSEAQNPKSPTPPTGSLGGGGPESLCEPWKDWIASALSEGLSVQRIYQDLVSEHQFTGSYYSVRRFARRLGRKLDLPFRRLEVEHCKSILARARGCLKTASAGGRICFARY